MKRSVLIFLAAAEIVSAAPQDFPPARSGIWRTLTDMRVVRSVASAQGMLWAASSGGLFRWESRSQTLVKFTNSEGLSSNDLTAVFVDRDGRVWVGTSEGSINVLDPGANVWTVIDDIRISNRVQKSIRTFAMSGDSLFVGTDFGVSVFRLSRWEFGDTYANLGFPAPASVNDILVKGDELWLATSEGVAMAPRFVTNLSSSTNWSQFGNGQGLPSNTAYAVASFHDSVAVGTSAGAAYFDGSVFQPIVSTSGREILAFHSLPNTLNFLEKTVGGYGLWALTSLDASALGIVGDLGKIPTDVAYDPSEPSWYIGTDGNGVDKWGAVSLSIVPNGPLGNLFTSLAVDDNSVLWTATGIDGRGRGFNRYNPSLPSSKRWKNFNVTDYPIIGNDDYFKVAVGTGDRIWVSSWGDGAVEVRGDSVIRKLDTGSTPSFSTSDVSNPSFPVIDGVAVDEQGRTWFVNWAARNGNLLASLTSDSTFTYHKNPLVAGGLLTNMVIDEYGTKWLANSEPFHPAKGLYLYYYNEDNLVSGTTGGWGFMTESDGLPDNAVLSVAIDRTGSVCVGTELGFMMIFDPLFPKQQKFSSFPLREQSVQAIAVDALNNKWVGTKEGLFVMNADATQILGQYTVSNSGGGLVGNDIRAVAIDQKNGIVYIGTENGLSSLTIDAVASERSFSGLAIGPNPFLIPSSGRLTIRNLVDESSIKILSVDGSVVSEFRAQGGGRAFWNGRDSAGNLVGSGIYFVVAFSENGDKMGTGKVAVIRK